MDKTLMKKAAMTARKSFSEQIRNKGAEEKTVDQMSYLWFIRCTALRYMQLNDFLPDLSLSWEKESVVACCQQLHQLYPALFTEVQQQQIDLMPQLQPEVLALFEKIEKKDWVRQPQIIGWLLQYYNNEDKERVFRQLKQKVKISAGNIPAVTQLFTPQWIVDFMVQNSLDLPDCGSKPYRILPKESQIPLQQIRCIDPCMGCGHILLSLFDELMEAYLQQKVDPVQAVHWILTKNIAGLDIDPRACHVAYFALMMKAREWDETILQQNLDLPLGCFCEMEKEELCRKTPKELQKQLHDFFQLMEHAAERGSLIQVAEQSFDELAAYWKDKDRALEYNLKCASVLSRQYDVVITNPPYMGHAGMSQSLSDFVRDHYPEGKLDLYACFILRCLQLCKDNGICTMITQHSWMFITSYRKLRQKVLNYDLKALLHLGSRSFEGINGEVVQTVCFLIRKSSTEGNRALCYRLVEEEGEQAKKEKFLKHQDLFLVDQKRLLTLPGIPLAYWISEAMIQAFSSAHPLSFYGESRQGMATADNQRFVRHWFEVDRSSICFDAENAAEAMQSHCRWFPYNKGGNSRKWYGNNEYVVDWENNGQRIKEYPASCIRNEHHFFEECFSWSLITTGECCFRYKPKGQCFDVAGMSCFSKEHLFQLLGFCNSSAAQQFLQVIAPTINVQCGDLARLPILFDQQHGLQIEQTVKENIELARQDWDQFETSWDFQIHPMLQGESVMEGMQIWKEQCECRYVRTQQNQRKLNTLFAGLYHMEIDDENEDLVTIVRFSDTISRGILNEQKAVKTLLHFAVGCMLKRYTVPGYDSPVQDNWLLLSDKGEHTVCSLLKHWLSCVYPKQDPDIQMQQIAALLDPGKDCRVVLNHYFCHDFYEEHVRMYSKCPVYWMIDAGKRHGFKALCSIHHWQKEGIGILVKDHLIPVQLMLQKDIDHLKTGIASQNDPQQKQQMKNRIQILKYQKQQVDQLALSLQDHAGSSIELDLDKGVRENLKCFRIFTQIPGKGKA